MEYIKLTSDQFHLISDWWHYAILNLIHTKNFKASSAWISQRLGLSETIVTEAWERLFRLAHLKREGKKIVRTFTRLETSDDLLNLSIQKAHLQDLELIKKSINEVAIDLRDHTSITLVLNKKSMAKAKELIRIFQDRFTEEIEANPGEEVYRLSISLFPLTHIIEQKNNKTKEEV